MSRHTVGMQTAEPNPARRTSTWLSIWLAWVAMCAAMVEVGHVVWPGTLAGGLAASSAGIGTAVIICLSRRRTRTR